MASFHCVYSGPAITCSTLQGKCGGTRLHVNAAGSDGRATQGNACKSVQRSLTGEWTRGLCLVLPALTKCWDHTKTQRPRHYRNSRPLPKESTKNACLELLTETYVLMKRSVHGPLPWVQLAPLPLLPSVQHSPAGAVNLTPWTIMGFCGRATHRDPNCAASEVEAARPAKCI